jgi:OOP family OmpA-OmpF porin
MKRLLIAAALSAALMADSASGQTYLGIGVGASRTDANNTSWNLYGGYQLNQTWGLELGYADLGHYRGSDIQSWSLAGTTTLPLGETWSLLGKLGAASNRMHFADSSNRTDLLLGVGVGFTMNKNLGLRLEYDDFGKLSNTGAGENSRGRNLGLSLKYAY